MKPGRGAAAAATRIFRGASSTFRGPRATGDDDSSEEEEEEEEDEEDETAVSPEPEAAAPAPATDVPEAEAEPEAPEEPEEPPEPEEPEEVRVMKAKARARVQADLARKGGQRGAAQRWKDKVAASGGVGIRAVAPNFTSRCAVASGLVAATPRGAMHGRFGSGRGDGTT